MQALKNGEADIIAPQASADTVEQLKALESQGVTVEVGHQLAYDHLDLNYSGPFADKNVREAFMKTVPRKDIVDKIVKKLDPTSPLRWIPSSSSRTRPSTPTPSRTTAPPHTRMLTSTVQRSC